MSLLISPKVQKFDYASGDAFRAELNLQKEEKQDIKFYIYIYIYIYNRILYTCFDSKYKNMYGNGPAQCPTRHLKKKNC